jgi:hypothetical protein
MAVQANVIFQGLSSGNYGGTSGAQLQITNWNEVMKVLNKLDKTYVRELRKNFREIAKPVQTEIRRAIPPRSKPPLSQMRQVHFGRLAWGSRYGAGAKPSKSVIIQTPNTRSRRARSLDTYSIARLQVLSPATVLFDMAGRRNHNMGRKGNTPVYDYMYTIKGVKVPGKRKHKVTPLAFAKGLQKAEGKLQPKASRIIWPAAEKALPLARARVDKLITVTNIRVNDLLRSK